MTAMQQWPYRGVPENPEAWLFQVARNRALDRLRHGKMATGKEPAIARESAAVQRRRPRRCCATSCRRSKTINLGCVPHLSSVVPPDARVALALKLVGGFSVGEIARAFLSQETTIAQRLVRAKRALRDDQVSSACPSLWTCPPGWIRCSTRRT